MRPSGMRDRSSPNARVTADDSRAPEILHSKRSRTRASHAPICDELSGLRVGGVRVGGTTIIASRRHLQCVTTEQSSVNRAPLSNRSLDLLLGDGSKISFLVLPRSRRGYLPTSNAGTRDVDAVETRRFGPSFRSENSSVGPCWARVLNPSRTSWWKGRLNSRRRSARPLLRAQRTCT